MLSRREFIASADLAAAASKLPSPSPAPRPVASASASANGLQAVGRAVDKVDPDVKAFFQEYGTDGFRDPGTHGTVHLSAVDARGKPVPREGAR